MSILNKFNKANQFDFVAPEDFEYFNLSQLYDPKSHNVYKLLGVHFNTKSKFGKSPVATTDQCFFNLPMHMNDTIDDLLMDSEVVDMINNGEVYIQIYEYTSAKWGVNYSVKFIEEKEVLNMESTTVK